MKKKIVLSKKEKLKRVLIALFSCYTLRELMYSFFWHLLNHSYGIVACNKGKNIKFRPNVTILHPERVFIGDNTEIGLRCILWGGKETSTLKIGKNVMIGPSVKLIAFDHGMKVSDIPMIYQDSIDKDIVIGDNVWIGANVVVTAGCKIGSGVVIAAGSIVTKDIPNNVICGGVPAKIIKVRV